MNQAQDKAIARASDHENLVGELVGALTDLVEAVRPYVYPTPDKPKSLWAKVEQARALIAKAEAQQ